LKPHPQRFSREDVSPGAWVTSEHANLQVYKPSSKEVSYPSPDTLYNYLDLHARSIIKAKFISENKILAVRLGGTVVVYKFKEVP
jgi:hypothetical protein